LQLFDEMIDKE